MAKDILSRPPADNEVVLEGIRKILLLILWNTIDSHADDDFVRNQMKLAGATDHEIQTLEGQHE